MCIDYKVGLDTHVTQVGSKYLANVLRSSIWVPILPNSGPCHNVILTL